MVCVRSKFEECNYIVCDDEGVGYMEFTSFFEAYRFVRENYSWLHNPYIMAQEVFEFTEKE